MIRYARVFLALLFLAAAALLLKLILGGGEGYVTFSAPVIELGPAGYVLRMRVSVVSDKPVLMEGLLVDGNWYPYPLVLRPGNHTVEVPLPSQPNKVKPVVSGIPTPLLSPYKRPASLELHVVRGRTVYYLYGSLPSKATAYIVQGAGPRSVLVLVPPGENTHSVASQLSRGLPLTVATVAAAANYSVGRMLKFDVVVFAGMTPSDKLVDLLENAGRTVVVSVGWGEPRWTVGVSGGRLVVERSTAYYGSCIVPEEAAVKLPAPLRPLRVLARLYGWREVSTYYALAATPSCVRGLTPVAYTSLGDVVVARRGRSYILSALPLPYTVAAARLGLFSAETVRELELAPFRGVRPLPVQGAGVLLLDAGNKVGVYRLEWSRVEVSVSGGLARVYLPATGEHTVSVEEYTYSLEPVSSNTSRRLLPGVQVFNYTPGHWYLVRLDGKPVVALGDEGQARAKPRLILSSSETWEMYTASLHVVLEERTEAPYTVLLNGVKVAEFTGPFNDVIELPRPPMPGPVMVIVRDVYGRTTFSTLFTVKHIYETGIFIASVLSALTVGFSGAAMLKRRRAREPDTVTLVFRYAEPPGVRVQPQLLLLEIDRLETRGSGLPVPVHEVIREHSRHYGSLEAAGLVARSLMRLVEKGKVSIASAYSPELEDAVTVVSRRPPEETLKGLYTTILGRVASRFGVLAEPAAGYEDVVDADAVLDSGSSILLVYNAPGRGELARALDRALQQLARFSELRLPRRFLGVAVVTTPELVGEAQKTIDAVLGGDMQAAARVLSDTSVARKIVGRGLGRWLRSYIAVAVPYTRLAPLVAGVKLGDPAWVNRFYRERWGNSSSGSVAGSSGGGSAAAGGAGESGSRSPSGPLPSRIQGGRGESGGGGGLEEGFTGHRGAGVQGGGGGGC